MLLVNINIASTDDLALTSIDSFLEALGVELVDDPSLIWRQLLVVLSEERIQLALASFDELLEPPLVHEDVVGSDADLT